jgi:hypothetical protein
VSQPNLGGQWQGSGDLPKPTRFSVMSLPNLHDRRVLQRIVAEIVTQELNASIEHGGLSQLAANVSRTSLRGGFLSESAWISADG